MPEDMSPQLPSLLKAMGMRIVVAPVESKKTPSRHRVMQKAA
jgi:cysteine synthase